MHVSTKNLKSEDYLSDVVNNLAATLPKKWYDPPNFGGLFNCSDVNSDIEFLLPDPPFTRFHGLGVSLGAALQLIHLQRTDCLLQSQGRAHQTHLQGQSRFFRQDHQFWLLWSDLTLQQPTSNTVALIINQAQNIKGYCRGPFSFLMRFFSILYTVYNHCSNLIVK